MRIIISCVFACLLSLARADAHAFLDHAEPRVGNTVKAPQQVTLWFTQNLEPAFSTVQVTNASGARVDVGKATVDGSDRHVLRIGLKPLSPGTYRVHWRALSVDTHASEGNFIFHVGP